MGRQGYQHTMPAELAEVTSEISSVINTIHEHRSRLLMQLGVLPHTLYTDNPTSSKGYLYLYNCEQRIENIMPKVASLDEEALETVGRELSYALLTTEEQYTIAGALCCIAFIQAVTSNKIELIKEMLSTLTADDKVTVFCPAYKEKSHFISQPAIATALMVADLKRPEIFEVLIDKVDLNSTISWKVFSFTSQLMEERSAILGAALLYKALMGRSDEVAIMLLEEAPELIRMPSLRANDSLLVLLIEEGMIGILDRLKEETRSEIKEFIGVLLPEIERNQQLSEEYINLAKEWCKKVIPNKSRARRISSFTKARMVYLFMLPLAFVAGIAFSGVGSGYIKNILASIGIPTGIAPAALVVLVISGIISILMERYSGVLDRATAVGLILSSISTLLPGAPAGPKTQESLKTTSPTAASLLLLTTIATWVMVGIGLLLIERLPRFSSVAADMDRLNLAVMVTFVTTVVSSLIIPPIYNYIYQLLTSGKK